MSLKLSVISVEENSPTNAYVIITGTVEDVQAIAHLWGREVEVFGDPKIEDDLIEAAKRMHASARQDTEEYASPPDGGWTQTPPAELLPLGGSPADFNVVHTSEAPVLFPPAPLPEINLERPKRRSMKTIPSIVREDGQVAKPYGTRGWAWLAERLRDADFDDFGQVKVEWSGSIVTTWLTDAQVQTIKTLLAKPGKTG